jgi:tight adherence protein C
MISLILTLGLVATAFAFAMPYFQGDQLTDRMKNVAIERTRLREKDRLRLAQGKGSLRQAPKAWMSEFVDKFNVTKYLGQDEVKEKLVQAGYRSESAYMKFMVIRVFIPITIGLLSAFYFLFLFKTDYPFWVRIAFSVAIGYFGYALPMILLKNKILKRYEDIKRAFPDALDLLLICVESGMTVEVALKIVSKEIGVQSVPLAEELTLTNAELSFLPDRKMAYENLAKRVDMDGVKSVVMALTQDEKYGTPLGQAMRVMAQENRDIRMGEAEKKAASIPPKLTIPMILCFLPVIFIVILGPAAITFLGYK